MLPASEASARHPPGALGCKYAQAAFSGCAVSAEDLPVASEHALAAELLPPLHRDPFDRMLVAQSNVEGITLLTGDSLVSQYPGAIKQV